MAAFDPELFKELEEYIAKGELDCYYGNYDDVFDLGFRYGQWCLEREQLKTTDE